MRDLFLTEMRRFRGWALAYAAVHLAVLVFLSRVIDLAQQSQFTYQLIGGVHVLAGLLLGLYQMGSYRRPNAWLHLVHRPLPTWRIALALSGACALLVALAVGVPLLLTALWQSTATPRVLDARHLWLVLSAVLVALCGYLAGGHAMLVSRRLAATGAAALLLLVFGHAVGLGAVALQAGLVAWLAVLVGVAFKPDLAAPPRAAGLVATAVPLQLVLCFGLLIVGLAGEMAWIAQGTHPNNVAVPPPGSAKEANNAAGRDLLVAGLQGVQGEQAALWREQAAISDIAAVAPVLDRPPVRGELMNLAPMTFVDSVRRVQWTFSHDAMRFVGVRQADQRPAGTLGVAGDAAFPSPPLPAFDNVLVARDTVYLFDADAGIILPRVHLPRGEVVTGVQLFDDRIAVLGSRALYLFDARELASGDGLLAPRQRVPLPGRVGNLTRIEMMELLDGVLVSFAFTRGAHNGEGDSYQQLVRVDDDGRVTPVARRALASGYGVMFRYQTWVVSPALALAQRAATQAFAPYRVRADIARPAVPRAAWWLAFAIALASVAGTAWWLRRTDLRLFAKLAWLATSALLGLPALLSCVLLVPARERLDDLMPIPA